MKTWNLIFLIFIVLLNWSALPHIQAQNSIVDIQQFIDDKKYEKAQNLLATIINDFPKSDSSNYITIKEKQALIQYRRKEYKKSANTYKDLLLYLPLHYAKRGDYYFNMGKAYLRIQDFQNFKDSNQQAANAFAATYGTTDNRYTKAINSLGFAFQCLGQYNDAKKVLEEARKIKEKIKVYDLQYGRILNQLGNIYTLLNKFGEAEECFLQSLKVKEAKRGKNRDYAKTQAYYARLLQTLGRYDLAFQQIEEAIAIVKTSKVSSNTLLNYLQIKASILSNKKEYTNAAKLYEQIKTQKEALEKEKSSNYAKVLHDLSDLYLKLNQLDKANTLIEEACIVFQNLHGDRHPYYAMAIRKKATILLEMGQTSDLEVLYKKANKIIARKYSKKHIEYFKSEYAYFLYLKKTQQYDQAIAKVGQIDDIITDYIIAATKYLSIQEIIGITNLYHDYFQEILSLASLNPQNKILTAKAFDCSLFYKGYVLEALLSIKKAIQHSNIISASAEQLTELKIQLNGELEKEEKDKWTISTIQDDIDLIERNIARNLGQLRKDDDRMSWELLQFELASKEAIIDFVRFDNGKSTDDFLYAAMIILPDIEAPIFINLFLESDITKHFNKKLTTSDELISLLYTFEKRGLTPKKDAESLYLYDLIWKPIAQHLNDVEKVFYVCDGILHNIALHAIPTDLETVVSDSVQLLQLTSFRNIITTQATNSLDKIGESLLIGGVEYGEVKDKLTSNRNHNLTWKALRWTDKEVDAIAKLMKQNGQSFQIFKNDQPTKRKIQEQLTKASDLNILHFATHGFFKTNDLLKIKSTVNINQANLELTNSGLVFANANALERKDALLTAFEISQLDLSHTELIVLSACETGLGQVYQYEGVYGMQRAFKIAGAEYLIMSLWQVPDRETKVFMTDFYNNFLIQNLSIPEAFYRTQQKMKNNLLDPIRWAGFVLLN